MQDWTETFAYNGIGNLDQVTVTRNATTGNARPDVSAVEKYTPAGTTSALLDRVTSISAAKAAGATVGATVGKSASTTTYGYDLLGHLTGVVRSPGESEFLYYAPGGELLYRQIGNRFVFYAGEYATVTATGTGGVPQASSVVVDAHVVFAGTRIASTSPARTLFYYRSRLGSVIATSLAGGVRGASYRYTPYGELDLVVNETDSTRSELGYTNAVRLTGALLHLKNRVYDPETRLFIQADVVDRLRYAYVAGDPVNFFDPDGLQAKSGSTTTTVVDGSVVRVVQRDSDGNLEVIACYDADIPLETQIKQESARQQGNGIAIQGEVDGHDAGPLPGWEPHGSGWSVGVQSDSRGHDGAASAQGSLAYMSFDNGESELFVTRGAAGRTDGVSESATEPPAERAGQENFFATLWDAGFNLSFVSTTARTPEEFRGAAWTQSLNLGVVAFQRHTAGIVETVEVGFSPGIGVPFGYSEYPTNTELLFPRAGASTSSPVRSSPPENRIVERGP